MKILKAIIYFHLALTLISAIAGYYLLRISPAKAFEKAKQEMPYDAIIVPGIPYDGDSMSSIMKARVTWAVYLFENKLARNIIFSGGAVYTPYVESIIMAKYAAAYGIPQENIFTETLAEHSTENVHYSNLIAAEKKFKKIALATDPFQSAFMRLFIFRKNLAIASLPIDFKRLKERSYPKQQIDPSDAVAANFTALPDRESRLQRLKGTLGWNISD